MQVLVSRFFYSSSKIILPKIDLKNYLAKQPGWQKDCELVAKSFHEYGVVVIKDPRVNQQQNDDFLDLMERYFQRRSFQFDAGQTMIDFSPENKFMLGIMHQFQQKMSPFQQVKELLKFPNQSLTPFIPQSDSKWRFHWNVGHQKNVIPKDFQNFQGIMNGWGKHLRDGCFTVAEMTAMGLGLQKDIFKKTVENGLMMLSPTGSDLAKHKVGTVLCGFHHDIDLLTIHGKPRFPGLYAWLKDGTKFKVEVPHGYLLLQAGKQLQWYTGGYIKAGFHQVIYTEQTQKAKIKAIEENKIPWRVASTFFCQVEMSQMMEPVDKFRNKESLVKYPKISAEDYVMREIYEIHQVKP